MVRGLRHSLVLMGGLAASGVAVGLATAALGAQAPSFSRGATSVLTTVLLLGAGWLLILAGIGTLWRGGATPRGAALTAAGFLWFASEWLNPAAAPALVFTLGLLLAHAWPAAVVHAASGVGPGGRVGLARRGLVLTALLCQVGLLGLVPALAFDPVASRCSQCPPNLLGLLSDPRLVTDATRLGFALQVTWIVGAVAMIGRDLASISRSERRRALPVQGGAAVALIAAGLGAAYSIPRGLPSNDAVDVALWSVAAVGLVTVSGGQAGGWWLQRRTRQHVARLALELAAAPLAGELGHALGRALGDPTLEVVYPLDDGRLVTGTGAAAGALMDPGRGTTHVRRGGAPVAVLVHRPDLAHDGDRLTHAVDAARLALENERLHAQSQARLLELRGSRAQIVAAADAERRRLERDLHDGSQQRLLALAIDLAVLRQRAAGGPGTTDDREVAALEAEVRAALGELRELAHGIIPRSLADDGLGPALEELAERSRIPIDLRAAPACRLDRSIEDTAYVVVARATGDPAVRRATVVVELVGSRLIVDASLDLLGEIEAAAMVDLEDRCAAVDGIMELTVLPDGRTRLHAEMPCGS